MDLFHFASDTKRQKLRDLGCVQVAGFNEASYWKLPPPDGRTLPEGEAFFWLEKQEERSE